MKNKDIDGNALSDLSVASETSDECGNIQKDVPVWERYTLTIVEAAAYYHIGEKKLRQIADAHMNEDFVIFNGNRILFKKQKFEKFLDESNAI